MKTKNDYLNLFGVSTAQLRALVAEGMKGGGQWCDLFFEDTSYGELVLRDGVVSSGGSHIDYGCGVRVLKGEKTGYAYAESTDQAALMAAARKASVIAAASSSDTKAAGAATRALSPGSFYDMEDDWRRAEAARFVPVLMKLESAIRAKDSSVHKVIAALSWQVSDILMYNSLDETTTDTRPVGSITATVIFVRGGRTEMNNASRSFRSGVEMIGDSLIEELAEAVTCGMDERFEARRPKGGKMPVVMAAGASGILLHEAMGHAFEADFNRKGQSIFSDKMGCRVAAPGINIIDDATIPGNRGSVNVDDEGVAGQKTYMVEEGILPLQPHPPHALHLYGKRARRQLRGPDRRRPEGYLRGSVQQRGGKDRRGRFHLLREERTPDREWPADHAGERYKHCRKRPEGACGHSRGGFGPQDRQQYLDLRQGAERPCELRHSQRAGQEPDRRRRIRCWKKKN